MVSIGRSFGANSFSRSVRAFAKKTEKRGAIFMREFARLSYEFTVDISPKDTGRFSANWRLGVGAPDLTYDPDQFTPANEVEKILGAKFDEVLFLTNATPYGPELDVGSSQQAPAGVTSQLEAASNSLARRALRSARSQVR